MFNKKTEPLEISFTEWPEEKRFAWYREVFWAYPELADWQIRIDRKYWKTSKKNAGEVLRATRMASTHE